MQAVGPAAVLAHPTSKQEPINFSRFGDVLNKVSLHLWADYSLSNTQNIPAFYLKFDA